MLTSARKTAIVEEEVQRMLERVQKRANAFNEDGAMMGDILPRGPERLDVYWERTRDLSDIELITDPDYELRVRQGLDRPPANPFWVNLLRVPGLFTKTAKDFVQLNARFADRYQGGSNAVAPRPGQSPLAAGGGLPLPQAPALGPAQPQAGGSPVGYGAP